MNTSRAPATKSRSSVPRVLLACLLGVAAWLVPAFAHAWEGSLHASGSVKLTLSATWRRLAGYGSDQAAWIGLTLPLERVAEPRLAASAIAEETNGPAPDAPRASEPPTPHETKGSGPSAAKSAAPEPALADATERPQSGKSRPLLYRLSSRLARQAVRAALRAAGRASAERWLDGLDTRSRSSSLLPELRLRGGRSVAESLRLAPTTSDPYRFVQAGGTDLFFDAQLTWKLDRLVFANEELAIERLRQQREAANAALVRRVLEALFAWQRAVTECTNPDLSVDERSDCTLRALEASITLDVLTGGWFTDSGLEEAGPG